MCVRVRERLRETHTVTLRRHTHSCTNSGHLHDKSPTPLNSVCPEEMHQLLSSSFLSQSSAHSSSGTYCTALVCLRTVPIWSDREKHSLQRHKKPLFPSEHRNFWPMQKPHESDLVFLVFCSNMRLLPSWCTIMLYTLLSGRDNHFYFTPILLNCDHHLFDYNHPLLTQRGRWEMSHLHLATNVPAI